MAAGMVGELSMLRENVCCDRWYMFRKYSDVFVGSDFVDWVIRRGYVAVGYVHPLPCRFATTSRA